MSKFSKNGKKIGRPSKPFNPEVGDQICQILATTTKGLEQALEEVSESLPVEERVSLSTIYWWLEDNPSFSEQYARARERQGGILHDRAQREAETARPGGVKKKTTKPGVNGPQVTETVIAEDNVQRSRLIVDTMLKRAGQLNPKKYGDTTKLIGDADQPLKLQVEFVGAAKPGQKLRAAPDWTNEAAKKS